MHFQDGENIICEISLYYQQWNHWRLRPLHAIRISDKISSFSVFNILNNQSSIRQCLPINNKPSSHIGCYHNRIFYRRNFLINAYWIWYGKSPSILYTVIYLLKIDREPLYKLSTLKRNTEQYFIQWRYEQLSSESIKIMVFKCLSLWLNHVEHK